MSGNQWFTSDDHFFHRSMAQPPIGKGWRPFDTVEEMNDRIVTSWNDVVGDDDDVWVLGDVLMGGADVVEVMGWLKGRKHLICGNHDKPWAGNRDWYKHRPHWLKAFATIGDFARRRVGSKKVADEQFLLSHFPYEGDHGERDPRHVQFRLREIIERDDEPGLPIVHGHVHDEWRISTTANGTIQFNVGVDRNNWTPVSLDEVVAVIRGEVTE